MTKDVAIGIEDFKVLIDSNSDYVDKTSLIKDLLLPMQKGIPSLKGVTLFLRPRRFGKTLTLSMLRYFFDIDEKENAYLFDGLSISREKEITRAFQNRLPVIFLTFKDIKGNNEDSFLSKPNYCLKDESFVTPMFVPHSSLQKTKTFERIANGIGTADDISLSLSLLTKGLYAYHKVNPLVLIDKYDVPLNAAHQARCFSYVRDIISAMFSMGLKTNMNLQAAVITGCLQIAKNQIFKGLNNLAIYPVTSAQFANAFGFTEEETLQLLRSYHLEDRITDVKAWYDGYHIGRYEIYNPFSLLNFIRECMVNPKATCGNYWASSSGDALLREMLTSTAGDVSLKETFEKLLSGSSAEVQVDQTIVYDTMTENNAAVMGTLLFSGYLTTREDLGDGKYLLRIPNGEVLSSFRTLAAQYNEEKRAGGVNEFVQLLLNGDAVTASEMLTDKIQSVLCSIDRDDQRGENHYHSFLAGYFSFEKSKIWQVRSQDVRANGRTDFTLINYATNQVIILEEKVARSQEEILPKRREGMAQMRTYNEAYQKDGFSVLDYVIVYYRLSAFITKA